jgi:hypothetical protein
MINKNINFIRSRKGYYYLDNVPAKDIQRYIDHLLKYSEITFCMLNRKKHMYFLADAVTEEYEIDINFFLGVQSIDNKRVFVGLTDIGKKFSHCVDLNNYDPYYAIFFSKLENQILREKLQENYKYSNNFLTWRGDKDSQKTDCIRDIAFNPC